MYELYDKNGNLICQAAGVQLNVAKELMGHSDISVTAKIYTHMVDEVFEPTKAC